MKTIFDDETIELKCHCGHKLKETIGRLKNNPSIQCACGAVLNVDANKLRKSIESAQKSLNGLPKNITLKF